MNTSIETVNNFHNSSKLIFSFFRQEISYSDSLDSHFYRLVLMGAMQGALTEDGYESFKNAGFELVRSETLKKKIIYVFEVIYQNLDEWRRNMISFNPVFMELRHSEFIQYEMGMKPQNIQTISKNKDAQSAFYTVFLLRNILLERLNECLDESQIISQLIKDELQGAD